jgi:hypothetical protein
VPVEQDWFWKLGHTKERVPAPPEREEWVLSYFPLREMTPEEWAGRHGASVLVSGLHRYIYQDPVIDAWIRRLGEILRDPQLLKECQERSVSSS